MGAGFRRYDGELAQKSLSLGYIWGSCMQANSPIPCVICLPETDSMPDRFVCWNRLPADDRQKTADPILLKIKVSRSAMSRRI